MQFVAASETCLGINVSIKLFVEFSFNVQFFCTPRKTEKKLALAFSTLPLNFNGKILLRTFV